MINMLIKKLKTASNDRGLISFEDSVSVFFLFDDFLAVVITAVGANAVCKIELAAVRTLYHTGHGKLPDVAASLVTTGFRSFSLRCCHFSYLLILLFNHLIILQLFEIIK